MKKKPAHSVRIVRLEVSKILGDDWKSVTAEWHDASRQCVEVANTIWQTWLVWHVQNGTADKLREWLERRKADVKAAGKCPVSAMNPQLSKLIYGTLAKRFGKLHGRVWGLLEQRIIMGIGSRKAASGSLPGWSAILLCRENMPSFTRGLPILFDKVNGALKWSDDGPIVELRLTRGADKKSPVRKLLLWSYGRRVQSQVAVFKKVLAGEFTFCGSSLMWDQRRKKWFVMLSYRRPSHVVPGLNPAKAAYLLPGRAVPFVLRERGKRAVWLQRRGFHIESMRQRVFGERRSRSEHYRVATARKGKGRDHAIRWRFALERKWMWFVRRVNHAASADAVKHCVLNGIGRLVYLKPSGIVSENRAVTRLGSTGLDQTSWEFFQLKTLLAYKCQDAGIEFSVIEFDGSASRAEACAGAGGAGS